MATFRPLLLALLLLVAPGYAHGSNLEQFMRNQHLPESIIYQMLQGENQIKHCLLSGDKMLCFQGKKFPGVSNNSQSRQAIRQGLALAVKNDLISALTTEIKADNLKNDEAISKTFIAANNQGLFDLRGIEFQTFCRGDWCGSIAAVPIKAAEKQLTDVYHQKPFIIDYCKMLLPKAKEFMTEGRYAAALIMLKELHDLKFADIEAYLLASKAFILENKPDDAAKITIELLEDFGQKLNSSQAEELGDLFVNLNMPEKAIASYEIASNRIDR